ncbi:EAL domain-containing protein [Parahaliea maris]|uniref:EAL domain-containing protein n=1 Tax=Parahaliea maris TaxID=2716870 RepID=A0A5C8ZU93_9GAMM|nr:GGDEF domain-containing phosphodiesterase [Parahaliea maris]TXS92075.1 EAL domain-containing protein [Parahaliea maris]
MISADHSMVGVIELADGDMLLDRHGRLAREDFQRIFCQRLQQWLRSRDESRELGDNRVMVVLHGIRSRGELDLATIKLERLFKEPYVHFGRPIQLGFRAGFTSTEDSRSESEEALRQANLALREARANSTNVRLYTPVAESLADNQRTLLETLEIALQRGELQLFYQPKLNTVYRSLAGAEALMRWQTADGAFISPAEFIPVAEANEIIRPLTWWAIKSAIARLARWPEDLSIAVNIAPTLLLDDQIVAVVGDALDIYGVTPKRLMLEVTERIMVGDTETMLGQLGRLRLIGVQVSLDDFGTGYSSLSYFRDLPVDEIKIDGSFVHNMLECGKDHAIVKAIIDLAHNFSLKVVAEGVETEPVFERLKELGCDVVQGYFLDRPLSAKDFEASYGIHRAGVGEKQPLKDHPLM